MQQNKVSMHSCKWVNQTIKEKSTAIKLKDENAKQLKVNESIKTLGIFINSSLNWNDEYEYVRNKLIISSKKIIRIEIRMHQVLMHFNVFMLKNVFFGCGIVKFSDKQIK